jgi:hypothetical protein
VLFGIGKTSFDGLLPSFVECFSPFAQAVGSQPVEGADIKVTIQRNGKKGNLSDSRAFHRPGLYHITVYAEKEPFSTVASRM